MSKNSTKLTLTYSNEKLKTMMKTFPSRVDRFMTTAAFAMLGEIKLSIQQRGTPGRTYKRGERQHVASAPGDPPNIDYGALINAMTFKEETKWHYVFRDGVEYGVFLEFGTENMAPRPFVSPVFAEWEAKHLAKLAKDMLHI